MENKNQQLSLLSAVETAQTIAHTNLKKFIDTERSYISQVAPEMQWNSDDWDTKYWLENRSKDTKLLFQTISKKSAIGNSLPSSQKKPLPSEFGDFCKATIVYFQRTRNLRHMGLRVYLFDLRKLFNSFPKQDNVLIESLISWNFEETIRTMKDENYSGLYDSAVRLNAIADLVDRKNLTTTPLTFQHGIPPQSEYLRHLAMADPERDEKLRRDEEKLPSREALEAYARCTNAPINNDEEILLRTIDLLVVMGQRGNEISCIPFDCWVEHPMKDSNGNISKDTKGQPLMEIGLRYYPEKNFQPRIHWLADQDVALAKRAVMRLQELTHEAREVAKWQEANPGRLWKYAPDTHLFEGDLLNFLGYANKRNLYLYLCENKKIVPVHQKFSGFTSEIDRYYRAGDIEKLLAPEVGDHVVLKKKNGQKWEIILKTSETLSIRFDGAFRFIRSSNIFKVFPRRTLLKEINDALGANPKCQSIFDRRGLKEADGTRIELTSHQPRHWRNTLYELAGMSNVQQALAMGRKDLSQNGVYQHTTLQERTAEHQEFLAFSSAREKLSFVQEGIRARRIIGGVTDTYHFLKDSKGLVEAEQFLSTHAQAMHLTPYGGCSHDFSQSPCPKHLQCWNKCSHLHRTNHPRETHNINVQIHRSEAALKIMKENASEEFGADVWIDDLEKKISNMRRALDMAIGEVPIPVFSQNESVDHAGSASTRSSVSDD